MALETPPEAPGCHLDPDLVKHTMQRTMGWKPLFGQISASQSHLKDQNIDVGDIFLFFGLFQMDNIDPKAKFNKHIIFGYLQIGKIIHTASQSHLIEEWMKYHPHILDENTCKYKNNTVYVARDNLSFNETLAGAGVFKYHEDLVLTAQDQPSSIWKLPSFFHHEKIMVSWNPNAYSSDGFFHSAKREQEFVIPEKQDRTQKKLDLVEEWVKDLVNKNA